MINYCGANGNRFVTIWNMVLGRATESVWIRHAILLYF